ncbi:hypothetical protein [Agrococcus jejuensis]|uniref:hypothetical protein n=1 Tax=Agrococcus jejuensis TaxID=399736 RepID=UPI000B858585|nr:hypothetical protein [Agrococcus jejuensis]
MARTAPLVGIAAALLVALAGCVPADAESASDASASPAPSATATPEPSAEPTPSASEAPEGIDTSDWVEYASPEGDLTFRHPSDWTLETTRSEPMSGVGPTGNRSLDSVEITAPNGQQLLTSYDFVDIGGWCDAPMTGELLHSEPIGLESPTGDETPVIAAIAFDGDPMIFAMGITAAERIGPDGTFGCPFYFVLGTSDGGTSMGTHFQVSNDDPLWNIASLDDATAYMETDEYATILEILRSVRTA